MKLWVVNLLNADVLERESERERGRRCSRRIGGSEKPWDK
jgi:hypothetical protein